MKLRQRQTKNQHERQAEWEYASTHSRGRQAARRKRRSEERITRPKRRKFIIWNRGILTSYLFLCVRHARLALTNLKLIGNSFCTLRGNFKIFGNLFGTLHSSLWNLCIFLFSDQIVFLFSTSLVVVHVLCCGCFRLLLLLLSLYLRCTACAAHFTGPCSSFFSSFTDRCICRHLIYSFGFFRWFRAVFGYFHSVINRICQLNTGAACVTLHNKTYNFGSFYRMPNSAGRSCCFKSTFI